MSSHTHCRRVIAAIVLCTRVLHVGCGIQESIDVGQCACQGERGASRPRDRNTTACCSRQAAFTGSQSYARRDSAVDVEARGGLRPEALAQPQTCSSLSRRESDERSGARTPQPQRCEGKHPQPQWTTARAVGPERRLCPFTASNEAMALEAPMEGWFRSHGREQSTSVLGERRVQSESVGTTSKRDAQLRSRGPVARPSCRIARWGRIGPGRSMSTLRAKSRSAGLTSLSMEGAGPRIRPQVWFLGRKPGRRRSPG